MIDYPNDHVNAQPDFGDDADVALPGDPQFDAWVEKAAPLLHVPPATPKLEMWDAIQSAQKTAVAADAGDVPGVVPMRRARWMWPAAVAAALLVGFALDRLSLGRLPAPTDRPVAVAPEVPTNGEEPADPAKLYRLAAVQTLTQAEALLTAYRASGVADRSPDAAKQLGVWGREVLGSTRLLLDSPAGEDRQLRSLLNDLELVLVQVIQLSGTPLDANERALIDRAMRDRDLLPRIRTAVPAGVAGSASD